MFFNTKAGVGKAMWEVLGNTKDVTDRVWGLCDWGQVRGGKCCPSSWRKLVESHISALSLSRLPSVSSHFTLKFLNFFQAWCIVRLKLAPVMILECLQGLQTPQIQTWYNLKEVVLVHMDFFLLVKESIVLAPGTAKNNEEDRIIIWLVCEHITI